MKREGISVARPAAFLMALIFVMPTLLLTQPAADAELKPELRSFGYFIGEWQCSGKFDFSGKTIEAHQHFAPELDGAWVLFRHDDKPPFGYHSLSEWGWDTAVKAFVMTVEDSGGGVRVFHSSGWSSRQLQWDGGALGSTTEPSQRFSFERIDDRHFNISYFVLKNASWSRVDASTCSKQ